MALDFDALDEQEDEARLAEAREAGFAPEREYTKIKSLWCLSDAHTDNEENMAWLEGMSATDFKKDALILAGDVSHDMSVLRKTFQICKSKFAEVLFIPGNHDIWIKNDPATKSGECAYKDSLEKIKHIIEICDEMDVRIRPQLYESGDEALWIAPIFSYHHVSWDTEPDLDEYWTKIEPHEQVLSDFKFNVWPGMETGSDEVAKCVDALNEEILKELPEEDLVAYKATAEADPADRLEARTHLVTFSHFVPRLELIPEKRLMSYPKLAKGSGSTPLARRIFALQPEVHVFGHTHFGWDIELDGTRYVQAPLSLPRERTSRVTSFIGEFANTLVHPKPLLLRDEDEWAEPYAACFSGYYKNFPRQPNEFKNTHKPIRNAYKWCGPGDPPPREQMPFEKGHSLVAYAPRWVQRDLVDNHPGFFTFLDIDPKVECPGV